MPAEVRGRFTAARAADNGSAPDANGVAASATAKTARLVLARVARRTLLDLLDDRRIGERRRVAKRAVLGDVAEQAPHDLAAARLRQLGREDDVRRLGDRADLLADVVAQLLEHLDRALLAALQSHVGDDRLTGPLVG